MKSRGRAAATSAGLVVFAAGLVLILVIFGYLAVLAMRSSASAVQAQERIVAASKEWVEIRGVPVTFRDSQGRSMLVPEILIRGRWAQPSEIEHVTVVCRPGKGPCGPQGYLTNPGFRLGVEPLQEVRLRPQDLHPALAVYWSDPEGWYRMKAEIQYIEILTSNGNRFQLSWGSPEDVRLTTWTTTTATVTLEVWVTQTVTTVVDGGGGGGGGGGGSENPTNPNPPPPPPPPPPPDPCDEYRRTHPNDGGRGYDWSRANPADRATGQAASCLLEDPVEPTPHRSGGPLTAFPAGSSPFGGGSATTTTHGNPHTTQTTYYYDRDGNVVRTDHGPSRNLPEPV